MTLDKSTVATLAWWKFGHVWLIVAGPAIVVVASLVTLYLAITRPDQLVTESHDRQRSQVSATADGTALEASLAPALQARNHAATGVIPATKP